jgi:hypothetical protein
MPPALFSLHSRAQRTTKVRLALSLAAASLDEIFEHPAGHTELIRVKSVLLFLKTLNVNRYS